MDIAEGSLPAVRFLCDVRFLFVFPRHVFPFLATSSSPPISRFALPAPLRPASAAVPSERPHHLLPLLAGVAASGTAASTAASTSLAPSSSGAGVPKGLSGTAGLSPGGSGTSTSASGGVAGSSAGGAGGSSGGVAGAVMGGAAGDGGAAAKENADDASSLTPKCIQVCTALSRTLLNGRQSRCRC